MKPHQYIRMSHLLQGINEPALIVCTNQLTVLHSNKSATELLGDITGKLFLQEDPSAAFLYPAYPDGKRTLIDFRVSKIKVERKEYWLAIGRKVEKQQTLKWQLQNLEKEKALHQMKVNFMSMASHEFRTPLTAISTILDLLETRMQMNGQLNEFYQHHLSRMSSEVYNLNNMLDEILTLSKIVSNNFTIRKSPVDVQHVINSIKYHYFSQRKDDRTLEVKVKGEPRPILADKDHLAKIFNNLIGNAFKYSTVKNPSATLSYHQHKLVVKVHDHGIGIPSTDIPHLFNSFFRGSNVSSIEGTGLGLAIVKTFVEANNGTISVESGEQSGTTFTVVFKQ